MTEEDYYTKFKAQVEASGYLFTDSQIRSIARAAADIDAWYEEFSPGTFLGDVYNIDSRDRQKPDDSDIMAALDRLTSGCFCRKAIFHPNRWFYLNNYFQERFLGQPYNSAWREICGAALFVSIKAVPDRLNPDYLYIFLRNEVRKNIERDLLGGQTLDEMHEDTFPDEDTPELLALEAQIAQGISENADSQIDLFFMLSKLSGSEQEIIRAPLDGVPDEVIAARDGVTIASIRKRRQRAIEKVK